MSLVQSRHRAPEITNAPATSSGAFSFLGDGYVVILKADAACCHHYAWNWLFYSSENRSVKGPSLPIASGLISQRIESEPLLQQARDRGEARLDIDLRTAQLQIALDPAAKKLCGFAVWTPRGKNWVYEKFGFPIS